MNLSTVCSLRLNSGMVECQRRLKKVLSVHYIKEMIINKTITIRLKHDVECNTNNNLL